MVGEKEQEDTFDVEIPTGFTVFCDMDGTFVDTDYANFLSYNRAIFEETRGAHDLQFSGERLNGESLKDRVPSLTDNQRVNVANMKSEYFSGFLSETRLNTPFAKFIRKISSSTEIILVSNCRERRAMETLRYHNALDLFARRICRENGSSNKYKRALMLTGQNPYEVIVFENEASDIENAVLAGVPRSNIISPVFESRVLTP